MQTTKQSRSGVAGKGVKAILVLSGTPSGFMTGKGYRNTLIPSSQFKWSPPLKVVRTEWISRDTMRFPYTTVSGEIVQDTSRQMYQNVQGDLYEIIVDDGTSEYASKCLFDRLPTDDDRRLVASAVRTVDPSVNESPVFVQLAVAGRSSPLDFFCGLRIPEPPSSLASDQCPW